MHKLIQWYSIEDKYLLSKEHGVVLYNTIFSLIFEWLNKQNYYWFKETTKYITIQIRSKKILPPLSSRMRAFALLGETWPMEISCLRVTDMTLKEALSVNIYTRSNSSKWIWTPSNPIWYREELQMHSNILLLRQKFWCNYLQNWQLISLNIINSCE